jgi:hypothetical protein
MRETYQGSCHCAAVQFQIATDFPELTTCDCSICSRKNALMVNFDPTGIPVRATVGKGML